MTFSLNTSYTHVLHAELFWKLVETHKTNTKT